MSMAPVRTFLAGSVVLTCALALALVAPLAAQEGPAPQMILVHQETVEPAMLEQYVQT